MWVFSPHSFVAAIQSSTSPTPYFLPHLALGPPTRGVFATVPLATPAHPTLWPHWIPYFQQWLLVGLWIRYTNNGPTNSSPCSPCLSTLLPHFLSSSLFQKPKTDQSHVFKQHSMTTKQYSIKLCAAVRGTVVVLWARGDMAVGITAVRLPQRHSSPQQSACFADGAKVSPNYCPCIQRHPIPRLDLYHHHRKEKTKP